VRANLAKREKIFFAEKNEGSFLKTGEKHDMMIPKKIVI
jgi:hypothetical protein